MSLIQGLPRPERAADHKGNFHPAWYAWLAQVQRILLAIGNSGTTSSRPTADLWIGRQYFDTTLGKPIFVQSLSPTVWVDATGASV